MGAQLVVTFANGERLRLLRLNRVQVHVRLRIGDADVVAVKRQLGILHQVEVNTPVVARIHPGASRDIYRGVAQTRYHNHRFGVGKYSLVCFDQSGKNLLGEFQVVVIANAKINIDASRFLCREVGDGVVGKLTKQFHVDYQNIVDRETSDVVLDV